MSTTPPTTPPADQAPADDWGRLETTVKGAVDRALDERIKAADDKAADKAPGDKAAADDKAPGADDKPKSRGDGFLTRFLSS